jgi:hypothetical protein
MLLFIFQTRSPGGKQLAQSRFDAGKALLFRNMPEQTGSLPEQVRDIPE